MPLDRPLAQEELGGDRPVGLARRNQPQDLQFATGQTVGTVLMPAGDDGIDPSDVRLGAEINEGCPRGGEFEFGPVRIGKRPAGKSNQDPDARCLVWRLDRLPDFEGAAQRGKRSRGVACGQRIAPRACAAIASGTPGPKSCCDPLQFAAGSVCLLNFPRGERDLDLCRQEPRTTERILDRADHPAYPGGRSGLAALGEP